MAKPLISPSTRSTVALQTAPALLAPLPRGEPVPQMGIPTSLWLCLQFPDLALEGHPQYDPAQRQAVMVVQRGLPRILAASPAALAAGVRPWMQVHAATVLAGDLILWPRDVAAEQDRLHFLAKLCSRYTPTISVLAPDALLLELRGSIRMFGGLAALLDRLQQELGQQSHSMRGATAITPLAATLLARAQDKSTSIAVTTDQAALRTALGPVAVTALTETRDRQDMRRLGVKCLRDLWRLPRDGLARRFGPQLLTQLDQLLGDRPDPRPLFIPAKRFTQDRELVFPSHDSVVVLAHTKELLLQLRDFLRCHDLAAGRIQLRLELQQAPVQTVMIGSREPGRDVDHWYRLFEQALPQQRLSAPVHSLCLLSEDLHTFAGQTMDWLQPPTVKQSWSKVLDALEIRLKKPNRFLCVQAEHRPERAWSFSDKPDETKLGPLKSIRPLWLLHKPRRLHAPPCLLEGPERIESGWWDGEDCCRDYYVAAGDHGERYWVFRDLKQPGWYLHGLFA